MSILQEIAIIWRKEMKVWWTNPSFAIVRSLVFPMMWIVIFGIAFSGTVDHIPVALVQGDFGEEANRYVGMLNTEGVLDITATTNYATAVEMLKERKVYGIIFIPPGFSKDLKEGNTVEVQLSVDETTPQVSSTMISFISRISDAFSKQIVPSSSMVSIQTNTVFGRGIEYLDFLAPGVIMMTIVFSAMFSGGLGLVIDREFGTLKMLIAAPISKNSIIVGKTAAGVVQSLFSGTAALLIAMALGVEVKTDILGFGLILGLMLITAFGFIGMSMAFATRITRIEHLQLVMMLVIMPMWFLSGGLYPLESMPEWMRVLAFIDPMTYATDAMRAAMLRGIIWEAFALDVLILVGFALSMLVVGSLSFKRTIE
jgi:ABC-2 type transport system permease protein